MVDDNREPSMPGYSSSRRAVLRKTGAGAVVVIAASHLPRHWQKPVISTIALPAHGETTRNRTSATAESLAKASVNTPPTTTGNPSFGAASAIARTDPAAPAGASTATATTTPAPTTTPTLTTTPAPDQLIWFQEHLGNVDLGREQLRAMRVLNLSGKRLSALPNGIFAGLTELTSINLANNALTALPENIFSGLNNLQTLWLYSNGLTALTAGVFDDLTALRELSLGDNPYTGLPTNVFSEISGIRRLSLDHSGLTALPDLSTMTALESLSLDNNRLSALAADGFSGLSNLHTLYLHNNQLNDLPDNIFSGLPLHTLTLWGNSLTLSAAKLEAWGIALDDEGNFNATNLPRHIRVEEVDSGEQPLTWSRTLESESAIDLEIGKSKTFSFAPAVTCEVRGATEPELFVAPVSGVAAEITFAHQRTTENGTFTFTLTAVTFTPTAVNGRMVFLIREDGVPITNSVASLSAFIFPFSSAIANNTPQFDGQSIADQVYYIQDRIIDDLPFPRARGGNAPLRYTLSPALPADLTLMDNTAGASDTPSATLSGALSNPHATTIYTYTVTDVDGASATLQFALTITSLTPIFRNAHIPAQTYHTGRDNAFILPIAIGGSAPLSYALSPDLPDGLSFSPTTRAIRGIPVFSTPTSAYTYRVTDINDSPATLMFTITVSGPTKVQWEPANATVANDLVIGRQRIIRYQEIMSLTDGNGVTYTIENLATGRYYIDISDAEGVHILSNEGGVNILDAGINKQQGRDELGRIAFTPIATEGLIKIGFFYSLTGSDIPVIDGTPEDNVFTLTFTNVEASADFFLNAAASGELAAVRIYIQLEPPTRIAIDVTNGDGQTALILAAKNGHSEVVAALLEAQAAVNHEDNDGQTALILAAQNGHTEIVEALLEAQAAVNHEDNDGRSALYWAVFNSHSETVDALRAAGADAIKWSRLEVNIDRGLFIDMKTTHTLETAITVQVIGAIDPRFNRVVSADVNIASVPAARLLIDYTQTPAGTTGGAAMIFTLTLNQINVQPTATNGGFMIEVAETSVPEDEDWIPLRDNNPDNDTLTVNFTNA